MIFPSFSSKDEQLLNGGNARDPMGLMPVWTVAGKKLIPNLASAVSRVEGIKSIILIYWLYNNQFKYDKSITLRQFFRIMEQLLEFFMYNNLKDPEGKQIWCYGIRTLGQGKGEVSSDNYSTMANGLYQFYRGATRNSKILNKDLLDLSDEYRGLLVKMEFLHSLIKPLEGYVKRIQSKEKPAPELFLDNIGDALSNYFSDKGLDKLLRNYLLQEGIVRDAARIFHENYGSSEYTWQYIQNIITICSDESSEEKSKHKAEIARVLTDISHCEHWCCTIELIYRVICSHHNAPVDDVVKILENNSEQIKKAISSFEKYPEPELNDRFKRIKILADSFSEGYRHFLEKFTEYHEYVMENQRNADPVFRIDCERFSVMEPASLEGINSLFKDLHHTWKNDYYITPSRKVYKQLFVDKK